MEKLLFSLNPTHFAGEFPKLTPGGGLSTGRAQGRHGAMLCTLQGGAKGGAAEDLGMGQYL